MAQPISLHCGQYYHIYNRGNNRENIFREERNYHYFLKLYAKHIEPIAETYAYCLLKNHFHLLIRIRDEKDLTGFQNLSGLSQPFSNFFNAYAKAFNQAYTRTGALFERPFGRVLVTSDAYFTTLVTYIHRNPQKHNFVTDFRDWPYSSYHSHLSNEDTYLRRNDVLSWFGNSEKFSQAHVREIDEQKIAPLISEDFD